MTGTVPPPERDLKALLAGMDPLLDDDEYAFCDLAERHPAEWNEVALGWFCETEGVTAILSLQEAVRLGLPHSGPFRRITLQVHSSLEAVGFLAALTPPLARAGISLNVVSAFHHDHLFVPSNRAAEALAILESIQREAAG